MHRRFEGEMVKSLSWRTRNGIPSCEPVAAAEAMPSGSKWVKGSLMVKCRCCESFVLA